jgi:hypothetical protein
MRAATKAREITASALPGGGLKGPRLRAQVFPKANGVRVRARAGMTVLRRQLFAVSLSPGWPTGPPAARGAIAARVTMDFGDAIRAMRVGHRVARAGWNGKGMYLFLDTPEIEAVTMKEGDQHVRLPVVPSVCMKTAQHTIVVGWLASQTDMLAVDWVTV